MIKLIIFDLDGVLLDAKEAHYKALNQALRDFDYPQISREDHIGKYDGLSTRAKLQMLDIKLEDQGGIAASKQLYTRNELCKLKPDLRLTNLISNLYTRYELGVASNAVLATVETALERLELLGKYNYFDYLLSNEEVQITKPHPEIYLKMMVEACVKSSETLIVEDSKHGREAAMASGAYVCGVDSPEDLVTSDKLQRALDRANKAETKVKWAGRDTTVLIPMAGAGSRFKEAGYRLPKPLIDVDGKPMIQRVIENLNIDANFVFVVQKEHREQYCLDYLLRALVPDCKIVETDGLTEGASCTTLLAEAYINNQDHLLIANSDQLLEWDSCDFLYNAISQDLDGSIVTFQDTNPKWSFAQVDENGFVTETAEKTPISNRATSGVYYFKKGADYVQWAKARIEKNLRFNNEFYVAPVYNEGISRGAKIKTYNAKMIGLGTPEDLQRYLKNGTN